MILLSTIIFFVFGLIIGSFLNVVILRYNTNKSLGGRSACMVCRNKLEWYELIPLFSFIILRGRCRSCRTKISWQYPVVEFVTGLVFALLFLKFRELFFLSYLSFLISYAYYAVIFTLLIIIGAYDMKHQIIPDKLVFLYIIFSFLGIFIFDNQVTTNLYLHMPTLLDMSMGCVAALPFLLLWLFSGGRWMGFGDVKLSAGIGWMLGPVLAATAFIISIYLGAIIGVMLLLITKKYKLTSAIPFAPFLIFSTILNFFMHLNLIHFVL